ncbi:MAG: phosphoglycerate dehydrogenase, partial [Candidatus Omnitrophica bacterium]|nr:phosphoglycerate dehydrogenase [Candidatus Omnitrophota bacterium]
MKTQTPDKKDNYKVLICDDLSEQGLAVLRRDKTLNVVIKTKLSLAELKKEIADADACVVRSGTQLTAEVIAAAKGLKVIGRAGVGLDNVDVEAASKRGVVVINTPGGNTVSAAEHTFCLIMALARNIPEASASLKRGEWERKKFMGIELYDKTLGVLGLGRIGTEVSKRAQSFGMRVIAYDPYLREEKAKQLGVELVSFEELLKRSDFLTLHMPLTQDNRHMIGEKELAKMKKGVRLVNCARGGLVDEEALHRAIESKHVAGAALDVFETEPPKGSALLRQPNVIGTPHLGASTEEAQVAVSVDVAQSVADYLLGRGVRNAVNMPSLDPEVLRELQPYVQLAEKIGSLQTQLMEGQILQVDIEYHGKIVEYETTPITIAFIKG